MEHENDLLDLVGTMYEAAAGDAPWAEVGRRLKTLVQTPSMALWITKPSDPRVEFLCAVDVPAGAEDAYATHYHALDPWNRAFRRDAERLRTGAPPRVSLGQELVDDGEFERSEFYVDFARRAGFRHVVGSVVPLGAGQLLHAALQRPAGASPFGERERSLVLRVLPHLARAAALQRALAARGEDAQLGFAALDRVPLGVVAVDAELRVVFANVAAETLLAKDLGIGLRVGGPGATVPLRLAATSCAAAEALERMVHRVTLLDVDGGACLLEGRRGRLGVTVARPPSRVRPVPAAATRSRRLALVLLREMEVPEAPAPAMLCDFFGFTRAEAEVAAALVSGASPASVAARRGVALATVRSQIRAALEKAQASSIRHLQRQLARLPQAFRVDGSAGTGDS
jgi:DNA-binding CsgD family transcriptional regulator